MDNKNPTALSEMESRIAAAEKAEKARYDLAAAKLEKVKREGRIAVMVARLYGITLDFVFCHPLHGTAGTLKCKAPDLKSAIDAIRNARAAFPGCYQGALVRENLSAAVRVYIPSNETPPAVPYDVTLDIDKFGAELNTYVRLPNIDPDGDPEIWKFQVEIPLAEVGRYVSDRPWNTVNFKLTFKPSGEWHKFAHHVVTFAALSHKGPSSAVNIIYGFDMPDLKLVEDLL